MHRRLPLMTCFWNGFEIVLTSFEERKESGGSPCCPVPKTCWTCFSRYLKMEDNACSIEKTHWSFWYPVSRMTLISSFMCLQRWRKSGDFLITLFLEWIWYPRPCVGENGGEPEYSPHYRNGFGISIHLLAMAKERQRICPSHPFRKGFDIFFHLTERTHKRKPEHPPTAFDEDEPKNGSVA